MRTSLMTRSFTFGAVVVAVILCRPANAIACGCGGPVPSSLAARSADVIFVGSVARVDHPQPFVTSHQNADGSVSTTVNVNSEPDLVVFDVVHVYKGPQVIQLGLVRGNTSCDMLFMTGEKWIVYGEDTIGGIRAFGCSRTRLYSDGAQDVIYLENKQVGRPQGIVYGDVLRHRDGASGDGPLFEPLRVIAANARARFSTTTHRWGPFELVLPPGDFEIWVERSEKPVAPRRPVHVENAADVRLRLIVEYPDAQPNR
jgi:hypothetical protein